MLAPWGAALDGAEVAGAQLLVGEAQPQMS